MKTYNFSINDHKYEAEFIGYSDIDPMWPLIVKCRCIGPYPTKWQQFNTEPKWFSARGLIAPNQSLT